MTTRGTPVAPFAHPAAPRAPLRFVAQSAADLRYVLCPAALDGARWRVLDRVRLATCGGELDLAIIGSSHVLTLRIGDAALTEVLACLPNIQTPMPPVAARGARGTWEVAASCGPARWTTAFEERAYRSGEAFTAAQAAILARRPALVRHFPQGPHALPPLTAIDYAVAAGSADLTTWHTYPQERVIVVTATTIAVT